MYCTNCGNKLKDDENYCTNCGCEVVNSDSNVTETVTFTEHENSSSKDNQPNNKGNLSLILGILACIFFWFPILSIPFMIVSFILGSQYKKETGKKSIGVILSIISLILFIVEIVIVIVGMFFWVSYLDENTDYDWGDYPDYYDYFHDNDQDEADFFDIKGYSWKGDDNSFLYLNQDNSYVWYQDDHDHQNNFYLGTFEVYNGNDAIEYITNHLAEYGITEKEQQDLFQNGKYDLEDYYLLILNCSKTMLNGQEQNFSNGSKVHYYGFYNEDTKRLDLINMNTGNKAGFTLKDKLNSIDI